MRSPKKYEVIEADCKPIAVNKFHNLSCKNVMLKLIVTLSYSGCAHLCLCVNILSYFPISCCLPTHNSQSMSSLIDRGEATVQGVNLILHLTSLRLYAAKMNELAPLGWLAAIQYP